MHQALAVARGLGGVLADVEEGLDEPFGRLLRGRRKRAQDETKEKKPFHGTSILIRMLRLLAVLGRRRAHGRAALSIVGIALGVALGYGVYLVNRAAVEDLAASVRAVAGEADLQVRGGRGGFPEALYPRIARLPGVAWVNPALELDVGIAGTERTLRVIGADVLRQGKPELLAPDKVLLSPLAAEGLGEGALNLVVGPRIVPLEISGIGDLKGFSALTDIATAQWRLERLGQLNRLDVHLVQRRRSCVGHGSDPAPPAGGRARRRGGDARAGERLPVARVPGESERARDGGALYRRLPRVLGTGAGDRAPAGRARASACAGPHDARARAALPARSRAHRRCRRDARRGARLRSRASRVALRRRRSGRRAIPRHGAAARVPWNVSAFCYFCSPASSSP